MKNGLLLLLLLPGLLAAQSARLSFASDTLAVGRPVAVRLEIVHPASQTVIFPASNEAFAPFEYLGITAEPTVTQNGQSRDVAVYQVSTFEMADTQQLVLPWAYVTTQGDTVAQQVGSGLLLLQKRSQPGASQLRADHNALSLRDEPDYVVLGLLTLGLLIALGIAGAIARKPLMRWYAQRHIRAQWQAIWRRWQALKGQTAQPAVFLEEMNHLWKGYLELGVRPPLRSFTTPELAGIIERQATLLPEQKQALINNCRWADEVIFAGKAAPAEMDLLAMHAIIGEVLRQAFLNKKKTY